MHSTTLKLPLELASSYGDPLHCTYPGLALMQPTLTPSSVSGWLSMLSICHHSPSPDWCSLSESTSQCSSSSSASPSAF
eukprot:848975-Rhodomonas_salina.4